MNNSSTPNDNTGQLIKTNADRGDAMKKVNITQRNKSALKSSGWDIHARTIARRVRKSEKSNKAQHRREFSRSDRAGQTPASNQPVKTVSDVVAYVAEQLRGRLVIALNGYADVKRNQFENPEAVWLALHCLATEVYDARLGDRPAPQLAQTVFETCGWQYAPNQSKTVLQRHPREYTTSYLGKEYKIDNHLKWGVGTDPSKIMRIAFAVDKRRKVIIVGYIGPHQRTRRS